MNKKVLIQNASADDIAMIIMRDVSAENVGIDMSDYLYMSILNAVHECLFSVPTEDVWSRTILFKNGDVAWINGCEIGSDDDMDYVIKSDREGIMLTKHWKPKRIVKIEENYCPSSDITFLMEYIDLEDSNGGIGDPISSEVIGFYYGKPNDEDTKYCSENRGVKLFYEDAEGIIYE